MDNKSLLYHYTSIDTLALILKNRTLRFNSLANVDDLIEGGSQDFDKVGRFTLVSCWTDSVEESIPLWNLYTPNMQGVRIGMKKYPFKQFTYGKGETFGICSFSEDVVSYIDYLQISKGSEATFAPDALTLFKVSYTDDDAILNPALLSPCLNESGQVQGCVIDFEKIGRVKKAVWAFQRECRYSIEYKPFSPLAVSMALQDGTFLTKLKDFNALLPYPYFDMELADDGFDQLEITMGPRTTAAQKVIIRCLVQTYCKNAIVKDSSLQIKL